MTGPDREGSRIGYLLKRYPRLSETFILHEILELERQGVDLQLFSLMDPLEQVTQESVSRVRAQVHYLPGGWKATAPIVRAHLALFARNPLGYLYVAGYVLFRWRHAAGLKHFWRAGWLARELELAKVTHLHAHFAHGPATVAHFVHLLTGMPYSVTAHAKDIYTSQPDRLATRLRAARFVVTCTGYNERYLSDLVGTAAAGRIHRIYHGLDLSLFVPDQQECRDDCRVTGHTILAVGRLVEKKGFPYLIEAVRVLTEDGYSVRLQIVGDGDLKETLRALIDRNQLKDRAELVGPRSQQALISLYRQACVVVLPSIVTDNGDRDGIPNVLVEAMRVGRPVVSTNVSGIPELVIDGQTGLLVAPNSGTALARALGRVLDEPSLRANLVAAGGRHVIKEFDLASNTARLKALLVHGQTRVA
jgi:glycosyltransferase involved in cell wall biosynthesis